MTDPNHTDPAPIAVEALTTLAHTMDTHWPTVEGTKEVRRATRLTANLLNALVDGDPAFADQTLHAIDDLYARFPGEDS